MNVVITKVMIADIIKLTTVAITITVVFLIDVIRTKPVTIMLTERAVVMCLKPVIGMLPIPLIIM